MEINIIDDTCWICGRHTNFAGAMTDHHMLPKHLKPKKNCKCPICEKCHNKLNYHDYVGLVKFAFKIEQSFQDLTGMVKNMVKNLKERGKK